MSQPPADTTASPLPLPVVGWREWVRLRGPLRCGLRAKVDTGAKSSSLHVHAVEEFEKDGGTWVRFETHPSHKNPDKVIVAEAPLIETRSVRSSSGRANERYVVSVDCLLHGQRFPIELTLAGRSKMEFPMLLGREALAGRFVVDVSRSWVAGLPKKKPKGDS